MLAGGGGAWLLASLAGLTWGSVPVPLEQLTAIVRGGGDPALRTIVLELRLPRVLLAGLVGAGLGVAGTAFQALLRNPLAEPYVLGVSGGAAVGAVGALVLGFAATSATALPAFAFTGAVMAVVLVLGMARVRRQHLDTRVLLLAGVVMGAFFNAVVMLVIQFADVETFRAALLWIMGSFSGTSPEGLRTAALYVVPGLIAMQAMARPLNLLSVGEQSAFHLGVDIGRFKTAVYLLTSLVVAVCVAAAGAIGFVGLVVPHALRLMGCSDHRVLIPGSALVGGAFLVAADLAARVLFAPTELPVGVVTALVGVPVFLLLLLRQGDVS